MSRLEQLLAFYTENPEDPFVRYCIALEKVKSGEHDEAMTWFLELIEAHPDYVATYYHMGKLQETMGNREDAIETFNLGMTVAQKMGDQHALSELMSARNELTDDYTVEFDD